MGKTVLYLLAALVIGCLMVVLSMCVGLSFFVLAVPRGEATPNSFSHAVSTGFIIYLVAVWVVQEPFRERIGLMPSVIFFILLPLTVMVFHAAWSLSAVMITLAFIAAIAAYQMLCEVAG